MVPLGVLRPVPPRAARTWAAGLLVLVALLAPAAILHAQELSERATERCVRSAVRVQVDVTDGAGRTGSSTGSGAMIDPRGYVLTNFHVAPESVLRHIWNAGGRASPTWGRTLPVRSKVPAG